MSKRMLRRWAKQNRKECMESHPKAPFDACKNFMTHFSFIPAPVALYCPMGTELSTIPLMKTLKKEGVPTALPRTQGDSLAFHSWIWDDGLQEDHFGFLGPKEDAARVDPQLFIIPMLAFDEAGHRLGYGQGHYDRTLEHYPEATKVGFAYSGQQLEAIPTDQYDVPMDFVVTEAGIETFS